jgi:hypothetical protein
MFAKNPQLRVYFERVLFRILWAVTVGVFGLICLATLGAVAFALAGVGGVPGLLVALLALGLGVFIAWRIFRSRWDEVEPGGTKDEGGNLSVEHYGVRRTLGVYEGQTLSSGPVFLPFGVALVQIPARGTQLEFKWSFENIPTKKSSGRFPATVRVEGLFSLKAVHKLLRQGGLTALFELIHDDVEEAIRDYVVELTPNQVLDTKGEEIAAMLRDAVESERADDTDTSSESLLESFGVALAKLSVAEFQCTGFAAIEARQAEKKKDAMGDRDAARVIAGTTVEQWDALPMEDKVRAINAAENRTSETVTKTVNDVGPELAKAFQLLPDLAEKILSNRKEKS